MEKAIALLMSFLLAGCSSLSTYVKSEAPWNSIQRVAVLPFVIPSENPTRRQMVTQMFAMELRRSGLVEVTEVPLGPLLGSIQSLEEVAKKEQVDAVFSGSVDDTQGTVVHVWLHDAATKEILWSGSYLVGVGSEFFSLRTQQQQLQRSIRRLVREFTRNRV